jgi:hypothetical protein
MATSQSVAELVLKQWGRHAKKFDFQLFSVPEDAFAGKNYWIIKGFYKKQLFEYKNFTCLQSPQTTFHLLCVLRFLSTSMPKSCRKRM